jgi:hypothetical protein
MFIKKNMPSFLDSSFSQTTLRKSFIVLFCVAFQELLIREEALRNIDEKADLKFLIIISSTIDTITIDHDIILLEYLDSITFYIPRNAIMNTHII